MRNWNPPVTIPPETLPVFSVPMRNWTDAGVAYFTVSLAVFSVPMRNWNGDDDGQQPTTAFLVYLWGIETISHEISVKAGTKVLAYLWGIETHNQAVCIAKGSNEGEELKLNPKRRGFFNAKFLAYLWGIETDIFPQYHYHAQFLAYLWGIETGTQVRLPPRWPAGF